MPTWIWMVPKTIGTLKFPNINWNVPNVIEGWRGKTGVTNSRCSGIEYNISTIGHDTAKLVQCAPSKTFDCEDVNF
jgi:hypothetical protein